ncbi:MAG: hypothetical protein WC525_09250 [Candidatus Thermoplasmatota archaeon]
MKKKIIILGVCLLSFISFFSGCFDIPEDFTRFSIMSFDVEPAIIHQGEYANLSWVVISADTVTIDNGIGSVALTGHRLIQPTQNTTYTLTASNATSTKSATAVIIVKPVPLTPSQKFLNITCTVNNATNRVIVASVDANVKWSDIAITTTPPASWQVQDSSYNGLAGIGTTATISAYVTVGDNIFVWDVPGNITVTLTYLPTNHLIGNWTVNV